MSDILQEIKRNGEEQKKLLEEFLKKMMSGSGRDGRGGTWAPRNGYRGAGESVLELW